MGQHAEKNGKAIIFAWDTAGEAIEFLKTLKNKVRDEKGRFVKQVETVDDPRDHTEQVQNEEVPPIYMLTQEHVETLRKAEVEDAQAVQEMVQPGSLMYRDSFEVIDKVTRELEQNARDRKEGYSQDEWKAARSSLMREKSELIKAWEEWGPAHGFVPPAAPSEEYVHFMSSEDVESYKSQENRTKEAEEAPSDLEQFIGSVLANTSFDTDVGSGDITRIENVASQLDDLHWDRQELAILLNNVPHSQLVVPTWSTPVNAPWDQISEEQGLRLARAPISMEKPSVQILDVSVESYKLNFNEKFKLVGERPMDVNFTFAEKQIVEHGYMGDVDITEPLMDSVVDCLRRRAYLNTEEELGFPGLSTLRHPDTQRVNVIGGSYKGLKVLKAPQGMKDTIVARFNPHYHWCGRCADIAMQAPMYHERLKTLKSVNIFEGKGRLYCHTPHVLDQADYRAFQAKMSFGDSWENIYAERQWEDRQIWAIRGNTGDWRCLLCGSTQSPSLDLVVRTRLKWPKWGYWDKEIKRWVVDSRKGIWDFTPAPVWTLNVRVRGLPWIEAYSKARPKEFSQAVTVPNRFA